MFGPGKYDDICTQAREDAEAEGVILMVLDGTKGSGFSCQSSAQHLLRYMADEIERDNDAARQ